ncbi:SEC14-like protein 4 isoform X2 [Folsomia candida]|nr:SEC14-like protein 4 isoform X2 [Folsomia candida]
MKEDIYLVKWLRARKFDVDKAVEFLNRHLSWRDSTNFDKLDDSDFQDFIHDYPYEIVGQDKEGKPILHCYLGDWDFRKAALAGKMDKMILYASKMFNDAWLKVRDLQQSGQNVTRYVIVIDVGKINIRQHINPASMPFYIGVVLSYERNFPKQGSNIWVVNTPRIFEVALTLARSVMDEETKATFKVYGNNREEWTSVLREYIEPDQLTRTFGGTMPSKFGF